MTTTPKTFSYVVTLDREWTASSTEGGTAISLEEAWTPEHLVLAGLVRCTLTSLQFHARRAGLELLTSGEAEGVVARRESDGRFAFAEIAVAIDVTVDPTPAEIRDLLAKAERDCFVGASLTVHPVTLWTVNGEEVR